MNATADFSWYKLINIKGLGPKSLLLIYRALAQKSISIEDIFQLNERDFYSTFSEFGKGKFSRVKFENFHNLDEEKLYNSFEELQEKNVKIVPIQDEVYPKLIKQRLKVNSPPLLYCKGLLSLLNSKSISIVGSRSADDFTLMLTRSIASSLANEGYNIVSGYAKGVDTNAHLGALEADGTTSVVLPLGIKHLSIKKNFKEFNWEKNTLFISQFLPFEKWKARNAMARNKIVTALSDAVIVITSGLERDDKGRMSGTFDAGKSSLEMNIPVFVLSPTLFSDAPKGNEDLIRLGAIEIKSGEDILSHLMNAKKNGFSHLTNSNQLKPNQLSLNL